MYPRYHDSYIMKMSLRLIPKIAALLPTVLMCSCTTMDLVTGQQTSNMYTVSDDIALGIQTQAELVDALRKQGVLINQDLPTLQKLKDMTSWIVKANGITTFPFDVTLAQTNIVNAMAMPGGRLLVFEGLWNKKDGLTRDDDELAAVLSHEIAHVLCRHATESITRQLPAQLIAAGFGIWASVDEKNRALAQTLGVATELGGGLYALKYSRQDELEADRTGMMYMARAGYNPAAALRIWKRAAARSNGHAAALSIFSTHPADTLRLNELEKHLPEAQRLYAEALAQLRANGTGLIPSRHVTSVH
jgi:predicted Zn-dependent protease